MKTSAKKLLLLDGLGALTTAVLLSQVLARFEPLFGMPKEVLFILTGVALCFAVFSISSYLFVKNDFEKYLSIIIIANIAYCMATFLLVGIHFKQLTLLGIAYFIGEIFIILLLVYAEYYSAKQSHHQFQ